MKKNNVTIIGHSEIYENKIAELTDSFVENELSGCTDDISKQFTQLLYYLHDSLKELKELPGTDDISSLDRLFDNYVRLCCKCCVLPTIEGFSMLTGIHKATFYDWNNRDYRRSDPAYSDSVKRWREICKEHLLFSLTNDERTSVNKIFIAKAAYGMREDSIPQIEETCKAEKTLLDIPVFNGELEDKNDGV